MTEERESQVSDKVYDEPIILQEEVSIEPQRYVAEKPYDLTRYEYSFLKRNFTGSLWSNLFAGASVGLFVSVLAKSVVALLDQQTQKLETWEWVGLIISILLALIFKFCVKTEDDKTKKELISVVDDHFENSKPRRVHVTGQERNDET